MLDQVGGVDGGVEVGRLHPCCLIPHVSPAGLSASSQLQPGSLPSPLPWYPSSLIAPLHCSLPVFLLAGG